LTVVRQRLDLGGRPCRRDRGVTMQPTQHLNLQEAVDQHEPIGVADHHQRHPPDLSHRADQPPVLLAIVNTQIAVPGSSLCMSHLHAIKLPAPGRDLHLLLRRYLHQLTRISPQDQVFATVLGSLCGSRVLELLPQGSQ
jgi:hypothetical protein